MSVFREIRENDCITYYPRFIKALQGTVWNINKMEKMDENRIPRNSAKHLEFREKRRISRFLADFAVSRKTDSPKPISYRFRDKRWFQSKIGIFFPPRVFFAAAEWVPLGIVCRRWATKTRMIGLPHRERSLTISSAVWIQCTNVTDRETDGRTDGRTDEPVVKVRGLEGLSPLLRFEPTAIVWTPWLNL